MCFAFNEVGSIAMEIPMDKVDRNPRRARSPYSGVPTENLDGLGAMANI